MYRLKQLVLLFGDLVGLYTGLYMAIFLRYWNTPGHNFTELVPPMTLLFLLAAIIMFIAGLYDATKAKNSWVFYQKIIVSALVWIVFGIIYFYINPNQSVAPKTILALTSLIGFGLIAAWRFFYNGFIIVNLKYNIVFAGITNEVIELVKHIQKEPQLGYSVAGIISEPETDADRKFMSELSASGIIFGKTIAEINQQTKGGLHIIVLSPQMSANHKLLQELYQSLFQQISIVSLSAFYESVMHRIPPFTFSEGWFVSHLQEQQKKIYDRFRILTDYLLAIVVGIFFAATLPLLALAIKLNSKGPIFFSQNRVGRGGTIFKVYKYRTMKALSSDGSAETNGPQFASNKDPRITAVGKFLRLTRLDEIPQFFNILKGQMSFIGPRPERPEFVTQITKEMPFYTLRHLIKPGLTGWAQVNNSYYGTIEENLRKLEYDLYYIKNRDFTLDISILMRTINTILRLAGR